MFTQSHYPKPLIKQYQPEPDNKETFSLSTCQITLNEEPQTKLLDLPNNGFNHIFKFLMDFKSLIFFSMASKKTHELFADLKRMTLNPKFIINASRSIPYSARPRHTILNLAFNEDSPNEANGYENQKKYFSALTKELNNQQRNKVVLGILKKLQRQSVAHHPENRTYSESQEIERSQFLIEACATHGIDLNFQTDGHRIIDLLMSTIDWHGANNTSTVNAFFACAKNLVIQHTDSTMVKNLKEQLQHQLIIGIMQHDAPRGIIRTQNLRSQLDHYALNYELGHPNSAICKLLNLGLKLNAKNSAGQTPEQFFLAQQDSSRANKLAQLKAEIGAPA